jgi:hypothetical protein
VLVWHKAPHRPWDPDDKHADLFADHEFPEPATLFDDHGGHAAAARAARMRVDRDPTGRDLERPIPGELSGPARGDGR